MFAKEFPFYAQNVFGVYDTCSSKTLAVNYIWSHILFPYMSLVLDIVFNNQTLDWLTREFILHFEELLAWEDT